MTEPGYDAELLPDPDTTERCAPHAERIGLDPGGSALWVDELIVVDVPRPWPKPVWAKDGFTAVPELVMEAGERGRRVRVLAAVPLDDDIGRIVTHRLTDDAHYARAEHRLEAARIPTVLATLLHDGLDADVATSVSVEPVRELLLCTQGSHDACCGSRGSALHGEIAARRPELVMRRVSHTGGHRMAPTGLTLPDGRMWGMVDIDEMLGIIDHTVSPVAVAARCRGWIGAAPGPAQMAERAVFASLDSWDFDTQPRTARVVDDEGSSRVEVTTSQRRWSVDVDVGRGVPTIACGAPGGLPAKPATEWRIAAITELVDGAPDRPVSL